MPSLRELTTVLNFETHTEGLEKLNEHIEGIHKRVELLAGVELARWGYEIIESFTGLGEKLESSAIAAGLTTDRYQELAYAAAQNAVSQEEMSGALSRFSRIIGSARDGSKGALATFAKVGITKEQVLSFTDSADGMQVLADKIKDIQDPIKRTQVIMQLLGRGSAKMTELLSEGGEGIREQMAQARAVGAVASKENIENLAHMEKSVVSLGATFKASAMNMAGYFAPAIIFAIERVKAFWTANHEVLEQTFQKYAEKAAFALGFVIGFIGKAAEDLAAFVRTHRALVDTIADLLLKFIEFKVATGAIAAALSIVAGPFRQLSQAFGVLSGAFGLLKAAVPFLQELGVALVEAGGAVGEFILGIGGATGAGLVAALAVALHDVFMLMTTGDVTKMWLYQLIMAIRSLSLTALEKLGLYKPDDGTQAAKDKAEQMPLVPITDGVNRPTFDFSPGKDNVFSDIMRNIGDLSAAQNMPPASLSRPDGGAQNGAVTYRIDSPITVNVPPGTDPKAMATAAKAGVADALNSILRKADTNTMQAAVY